MNEPSFATAVMTVPERCHSFGMPREAVEELQEAGLWKANHGVRIDREKKDGAHIAYLKAAEFARYCWPNVDWYLIAQDDIEVTKGLSSILWDDLPTSGIVSLFTPRHAHAQRPGPGWWQIAKMRGSYGAQLILWPRDLLIWYLSDAPRDDRVRSADHEILLWLRDNDLPLWFHNPSYTLHTGAGHEQSTLRAAGGSPFGRQCHEFLRAVGGPVKQPE